MKILIPDTIRLPEASGPDAEYIPYSNSTGFPRSHRDAEVLVVWGADDKLLGEAARRLPRLRLVQLLSAGYEAAIKARFGQHVIICNGRGLHDEPVAEHALALILAAARRLHLARDRQRERYWDDSLGGIQDERVHDGFRTLHGANVVIWGMGSIGSTLAPLLSQLGASVVGVARSAGQRAGCRLVDASAVDTELAGADVLVMILPSSPTTRGALDASKMALLRPHSWVVNVGRGDTVEQGALLEALRRNRIGGAALDVTDPEPLPPDSELWTQPNVIITPHAAGGRPRAAECLIETNLQALRSGGNFQNRVETYSVDEGTTRVY